MAGITPEQIAEGLKVLLGTDDAGIENLSKAASLPPGVLDVALASVDREGKALFLENAILPSLEARAREIEEARRADLEAVQKRNREVRDSVTARIAELRKGIDSGPLPELPALLAQMEAPAPASPSPRAPQIYV